MPPEGNACVFRVNSHKKFANVPAKNIKLQLIETSFAAF
jgi:hypothetical protein